MLPLTICCLFLLAFINYRLGRRALFHPGVVFCSTWAAGLLLVWACGNLFYPLSPQTLMNFLAGAAAFSAGTALSYFGPALNNTKRVAPQNASNWIINALFLLVILSAPVAIRWMLSAIAQHPASNFLVQASMTMLDETLRDDPGYIFFGNVVTLSSIVALLAFMEKEKHRTRWVLSIFTALALMILTAGRASLVVMILSLLCLDWIRIRRLRWGVVLIFGLTFALLIVGIAVYLGKAGASTEASVTENAAPVGTGLALYAAGSLVAYDRVVREPNTTPHNWRITRFLEQRLSRIDKSFKPPSEGVEYVNVGPNQLNTNTYTLFFALIDFGIVGMMLLFVGLGWITAFFYHRALQGEPIAVLIYASLFCGIVLSLFGDYFFNNLNYLLKLFFISWCVYVLPRAWASFRRVLGLRIGNLVHFEQRS